MKLTMNVCNIRLSLIGCLTALHATVSLAKAPGPVKVANYDGSVVCAAGEVINAQNVADIQRAVQRALETGKSLKVRSHLVSHSYSPVICPATDGIILNVEALQGIIAIDSEALSVTVQPGIKIGDLQERLNAKDLAFPVTSDFNGVSIAGGMGTGAHNSSLQIASGVADWVEEIKLVDGTGAIKILSGAELDAGRVHLGLLGVIFELKLKLVPQFKLQRQFFKMNHAAIEDEGVALVRKYAYAKISWFPSQETYFVEALDRVPLSTPGNSLDEHWTTPAIASVLKVFTLPIDALNASKILQCTAEAIRVNTWASSYTAVDSPKDNPVGLSYNMIGSSCATGTCAWNRGIQSRSIEAAIALKDFSAWAVDVKELISRRKGCFPLLGIYLRFSAPSNAYLGQAYGQESVMFEIHIPTTNTPVLESSSEVYDEILQMTLAKYQGRPHWGKNSQPYFNELGDSQYPRWDDFRTLQKSLDPNGIFENPFWQKIVAGAASASNPGCGVNRSCICSQNSDCGKRARCESGILFSEAKICVKGH